MRLIYRPEREEIPRSGGRYYSDYRLNPGINELSDSSEKYFQKFLLTDEGKELLTKTILEVYNDKSEPIVSNIQKTYVAEPMVTISEESVVEEPKPKRLKMPKTSNNVESSDSTL